MYMSNVSSVGQKMKIPHGKEKIVAANLIREAGVIALTQFGVLTAWWQLGWATARDSTARGLTNSMNQRFRSLSIHRAIKRERKYN